MEEKMIFDDSFDKVDFGAIDEGEYECVLKCDKRVSRDGTKTYLNIDMKVRDDVNQNFKGRHIFGSLWPDTNRPTWFDLVRLNKLVKSQKGLPNYRVDFADVDECILFLNGINLRVKITKTMDDGLGKEVNKIDFYSIQPSKTTLEEAASESPVATDDLPF